MPFWLVISAWTVRIAGVLLLALSAVPFVHTGWWAVRVCDFPRVQLAVLALVGLGVVLLFAVFSPWRREPWFWAGVFAWVGLWQGSYIVRYTSVWPRSTAAISGEPAFTLAIVNLDFRNTRYDEVERTIERLDPDLLLLIELDEHWAAELAAIRERRPHRLEAVRGEGLGLALWSKKPLGDAQIEYLVTDRRPSLHASIPAGDGRAIRFVGVHPTPPGLGVRGAEGRHDSRIRDAELILVADRIAESRERDPHGLWLVAGDFNDVAWSGTTSMFVRRSGLNDPRVGRSLLNTYHAEYKLLRYPLDHIFVSPDFTVGRFERVEIPGSDHFGVIAELGIAPSPRGDAPEPEATETDEEVADEIVEEGVEDAQENAEERRENAGG